MDLEETLEKLIREQGKSVVDDSRRFASLISDYLGTEFRSEKRLLQSAVEAGYARELSRSSDPDLTVQKLIRDFEAEYSITADAARKTLLILARALGLKVSAPAEDAGAAPAQEQPALLRPKPKAPLAPEPKAAAAPPKPAPSLPSSPKPASLPPKPAPSLTLSPKPALPPPRPAPIPPSPPKTRAKSRSGFPFGDDSFLWKASVWVWGYGSAACIVIGIIKSLFGDGGMFVTGVIFLAAFLIAPKIMHAFPPPLGVQFAVRVIAAFIIFNTLFFGTFSSGRSNTSRQAASSAAVEETIPEPPVDALLDRQGETIRNGVSVSVPSTNGAGRIYRVAYTDDWTVISAIRTSGEHNQIVLGEPGASNSFYVEDNGEKYPLRALRYFDDREAGAGVDLIFGAINTRNFNLIEGDDVSESAWHFLNVNVP
jgi:hypothetical protein